MSTTRTPTLLTDTDMEVMRILHHAFRRDGARLEQAAERYGTQEAAAHEALLIGWHGMASSLHHHHTVEDTHIWPVIRAKVAGTPDVEILDAMEEEHSRIDPAIERIERSFGDPDSGVGAVAESIDAFLGLLRGHLEHEEKDAFPLIRRFITKAEWDALNKSALKELSLSEIAGIGPWLLDGATPEEVRTVLSELPPPVRLLHRYWWNPRYRRTRRWG
ncbi:MAG: hemerythrin domain-containing protein [Dermatophilaceae bacterium]